MVVGAGNSSDLCNHCRKVVGCPLRVSAGGPVLFCAEYLPASQPPHQAHQARPAPPLTAQDGGEPGLLGLCATCESRSECDLPKPETGVWHCEHYK